MTTDDITYRPGQEDAGMQPLQEVMQPADASVVANAETQMKALAAAGVLCPNCGMTNEPDAAFCASCGQPLRSGTCPNCGSEIDIDADFCEVCHHYIKSDVCSFCGARLSGEEPFCPECGSPRGGIICPTCNTLNDFAFCKKCGTPLTDEARALAELVKNQPEYRQLAQAASELEELNMQVPLTSERDIAKNLRNERLRERVLTLLAKDEGVPNPIIPKHENKRMTKEELDRQKRDRMLLITELLNRMEQPPQPSPIKARNYAMAQKPVGVRLAWMCNFKHAMHSSPCGCAKPQLGGKWVILGKDNKQDIKDDK